MKTYTEIVNMLRFDDHFETSLDKPYLSNTGQQDKQTS